MSAQPEYSFPPENNSRTVQENFIFKKGNWFIIAENGMQVGPYADKADAQLALLYYKVRSFWPNDKELRKFGREGQ